MEGLCGVVVWKSGRESFYSEVEEVEEEEEEEEENGLMR